MEEKIVKAIILKIGNRDMELSVEDARQLYDALGELFSSSAEKHRPYYYYYYHCPWSVPEDTTAILPGTITIPLDEEKMK